MMERRIYFISGKKSYDISENSYDSEAWYDWIERTKNSICRMTVSRRVLLWLCQLFHKASVGRDIIYRRWKMLDQLYQYYCSQNYNYYGRYIHIVAVQGSRRSVIILPEVIHSSGWTWQPHCDKLVIQELGKRS